MDYIVIIIYNRAGYIDYRIMEKDKSQWPPELKTKSVFYFYHFQAKILVSIFSRHSSSTTTINSILGKCFVLGNIALCTSHYHHPKKRPTWLTSLVARIRKIYMFILLHGGKIYISYEHYYYLAKVHESSEKSFFHSVKSVMGFTWCTLQSSFHVSFNKT